MTLISFERLKPIIQSLASSINKKADKTDLDTLTQTINSIPTVPSVSSTDNNKVLMVINGAPSWQAIQTIYSGTSEPQDSTGSDGDIYLVTE